MRLTIPSERLAAFLALGWECVGVDEGVCTVEHDGTPKVPCSECGEPCEFRQWVRLGSECSDCFEGEERTVLH